MKHVFDLLFGFALLGNAALFVPQALALWRKKNDEGVSLITFGGFNLLQAIAVIHGLYWHDLALIVGMIASLITCGAVTLLTLKYRIERKRESADVCCCRNDSVTSEWFVAAIRKPSVFLRWTVVLVLLSLSMSPLRHNAAYVKPFDLVILFLAALLLIWSVFLWLPRREAMRGKGLIYRGLRFLCMLLIMAPFILTLLYVIGDLAARELPIYESSVEAMRSSPAAQTLGDRITIGWPIDLVGEASSDSGHVEVSIPVTGTVGKANLRFNGVKVNGVWSVKELYLIRAGSNAQLPVELPSTSPERRAGSAPASVRPASVRPRLAFLPR